MTDLVGCSLLFPTLLFIILLTRPVGVSTNDRELFLIEVRSENIESDSFTTRCVLKRRDSHTHKSMLRHSRVEHTHTRS